MAEERARLPPDFENSKKQTQAVSTYAPPSSSSSLHMQKTGSFHTEVSQRRGGGGGPPLGAYLSMSGAHRPDGVGGGSSKGVQFTNVIYESGSAHADDLGEEGSKKKKVGFLFSFVKNPGFLNRSFQKTSPSPHLQAKRTQFSEQYICVRCGRTVSPEWRKVKKKIFFLFFRLMQLFLVSRDLLGRKRYATHADCDGQNRCGRWMSRLLVERA